MKKVRNLGLVAAMVLALGAFVGVASASASVGVYVGGGENPKFEAEEYGSKEYGLRLTGTGKVLGVSTWFNFFGTEGSQYCTSNQIESELSQASPSLYTLTTYSGCTSNGLAVTVEMNKCLQGHHLKPGGAGAGTMDLVCTGEYGAGTAVVFKRVLFGQALCTATVPSQGGFESSYSTMGSGSERSISGVFGSEHVKYTLTGSGCGEAKKPGTYTDGIWGGAIRAEHK